MTIRVATAGYIHTPFTILIDTAEKQPWVFGDIQARSFVDPEQRRYVVRTQERYLGVAHGDYSLDGYQDRVALERKSAEDFRGTLLGWPKDMERVRESPSGRAELDRRGRFKRELATLEGLRTKAAGNDYVACIGIIVEASLSECLRGCKQWGTRTAEENARSLFSTFLAWSQEFAVPWYFCDSAEMAAVTAFRMLEKFWAKNLRERKKRKGNETH